MFDHVTIRVTDRGASERFYTTVLSTLGIDTTFSSSAFAEWQDFSLTETDEEHAVTRRLHVGFVAPSVEQVEDFWAGGTEAGYTDDGRPGPRPEYGGDYYGAFLLDPDGNSAEAVHHDELRRGGAVDHLWIRVADLEAASAFYRKTAAAAGFEVTREGPDRTAFRGQAGGGTFSLLPGPPTQNLHMAFPGDNGAVERFYADLTAAGHRGNGAPMERPQYHPGYYAAYVIDPDGNNIEVVNHRRGA